VATQIEIQRKGTFWVTWPTPPSEEQAAIVLVNVLCISSKIYNFLEEARQAHEPAHRQPPGWLFYLIKAAQHPGFFPRGMARREQNRSRNNHRCFALLIHF